MTNELLHCLLLIIVANGSPILGRLLFDQSFDLAIDFGQKLPDGNYLFGPSKTWRGVFFSLCITTIAGLSLGYSFDVGFLVAVYALCGDLLSSFTKRRMDIESSGMAPLLDQVPESALPAIMMAATFELDKTSIMLLVLIFIILELSLSHILHRWGLRKRPY
jgi:CDP-2,3-bis-(O-geranylgeranyl)-sn-glycerol synthase